MKPKISLEVEHHGEETTVRANVSVSVKLPKSATVEELCNLLANKYIDAAEDLLHSRFIKDDGSTSIGYCAEVVSVNNMGNSVEIEDHRSSEASALPAQLFPETAPVSPVTARTCPVPAPICPATPTVRAIVDRMEMNHVTSRKKVYPPFDRLGLELESSPSFIRESEKKGENRKEKSGEKKESGMQEEMVARQPAVRRILFEESASPDIKQEERAAGDQEKVMKLPALINKSDFRVPKTPDTVQMKKRVSIRPLPGSHSGYQGTPRPERNVGTPNVSSILRRTSDVSGAKRQTAPKNSSLSAIKKRDSVAAATPRKIVTEPSTPTTNQKRCDCLYHSKEKKKSEKKGKEVVVKPRWK